jgi:tripartite-type tricarboxylate transporter receptor subunit TctC
MNFRIPALSLAAAALLTAVYTLPGSAHAQSGYPSKPVRMLVPFGAGGPADIYARIVAQRVSEPLGQQVVVEDRPGAGSVVGTEAVARSAPDGHTLLVISNTHPINETLYPKLPYNLLRDFTAITQINVMPNVLVVRPDAPFKSVQDLIAYAKANPGKLNYASSGSGTPYHLAAELFKAMTGTSIVHIPHKASGEARASVLGGQTNLMFDSLPTTHQQVNAGKLRALGITSTRRSPLLPNVPTVAEAGVSGYEADLWLGLLAPAGTPPAVVNRLNAETVKVLHRPDVRELFAKDGTEPIGNTPQQFAAVLKEQVEKWGKVVRFSGAKVE